MKGPQMQRTLLKTAVTAGIAACMALSAANAASPVKAGALDCTVSDVDKTLFQTHLVLACSHVDANGNNVGNYQAEINRTGLKLGPQQTTSIGWAILTLGDPENVNLDGVYVGASASASLGAGAGANYLTGGFQGKISLQPWSAEGKTGFGIDLSGQKMEIRSVPPS